MKPSDEDKPSLLWGDTRDGLQRLSNLLVCGILGLLLVVGIAYLLMKFSAP